MEHYQQIRQTTWKLCDGLSIEDMGAQSMPDASPVKWHLAHTSWFFETFLLQPFLPQYKVFNRHFEHLFNSYYQSVGQPFLRPQRGLLTRPSLGDVLRYREHVDESMMRLLDNATDYILSITEVGLHHEMQHQELLLTDVLHLLAHNPLLPAIKPSISKQSQNTETMHWTRCDAQLIEVGASESGFSYDCEKPIHKTYLSAHALANRLITNEEWLEFIADRGYTNSQLWLSDGWAALSEEQWQAPLYWHQIDGQWYQFGLDGLQPLQPNAPVCHISYFEADAFARWAGKRLPREHELEFAQQQNPLSGDVQANLLEQRAWRARAATTKDITQLYGDVWEWTQSAYLPYPNFRPEQGALGEYNGKFMVNQWVLKGGACVTPALQLRPSYRNFFYPHQRWQFTGLRLAHDIK